VREVHEEVGLAITPLTKVWESVTGDGQFRLHWWTADTEAGEVIMEPGEVSDARSRRRNFWRWSPPSQLIASSSVACCHSSNAPQS
jgi:8-oxo-dGTP pyrophosphatase MutT (NUDIX family)